MSYRDPITVSGSLVTFNDPDGDGRITNLSAAFSPVQDLNGYDHPWPDGGGVNKYDKSADYYGQGKFWKSDTGALTSSNDYYGSPKIPIAPSTQYARTSGTSANIFYDSNGDYLSTTFTGGTFTSPANAYYVTFNIANNVNHDTVQFEQGASLSSYSPYSNICPISGRAGLSVYRTGKNLLNDSLRALDGHNIVFGGATAGYAGTSLTLPAGTYTISVKTADDSNTNIYCKDVNTSNQISGFPAYSSKSASFTLTETMALRVYVYKNTYSSVDDIDTVQVEVGSSATTYEPYNGNTYSVDWTTQAGTVYGGTLDVTAGTLTVDRVMVEIKNAYGSGTYNPTTGLGTFWYTSGISTLNSANDGVVCNRMITTSNVSQTSPNGRIVWFANGIIRWTEMRDMSVEDYNAWLNDNPLQVTYKLPTPLTYQLSAQTIQTLLGTNNIWADAGDVTVTYQLARHGFEGWLIKVGTEQTEIPINFIRYSTYKVTPDQRMEWSAERNVNGVLQRETVPNMPPKIEFNTKLLTNSDVTALMSILNKSFTVASERKLPVYFYDPENNTYKTWDCYMPDIDFKIRNVDTVKNIINYEELRFAFIGY